MMSQEAQDSLEHTSGLRPFGEYPDHCDRCRVAHGCAHAGPLTEFHDGTGHVFLRACDNCGIRIEA